LIQAILKTILNHIKFAYKNKFNFCATIDADGTHDPEAIVKMLDIISKKSNNLDIINTNRFLNSNSLADWPFVRKYITLLRYILVKVLLKTNLDSSGGLRLYNLNTIKFKDFFLSKDKNYFYLISRQILYFGIYLMSNIHHLIRFRSIIFKFF
jgi:hypothetical protein